MFAIAELTIRKLKEPAFFLMFVFAIIIGIFSSGMGSLAEELTGSIFSKFINTGYGYPILTSTVFILLISILISVFIGATEIPRDIDTGLIMLLLAKPISKQRYLMGKYLGILGLCTIFFVCAEIAIFVTYYFNHNEFYSIGIMLRQMLLFFSLLPIVALTVMISCFVADFSAMILTSIYLIFSIFISLTPLLIEMLPKSLGVAFYWMIIYYFFPNFVYYFQSCSSFSIITLSLIVYSVSMTFIFLAIAHHRMATRDLI